MSQINLKPCMAYDAICYLQHRFKDNQNWLFEEEVVFIEKINALTEGKLADECLGMSSLSYVISTYTDNKNIETYTLTDLAEIFKDPEDISQVVRSKVTSEFTAGYLFPMLDMLCEEWAQKYYDMLLVLKEAGFEELWKSDILPEIQKDIERKSESIKNINADALFSDICRLKQCEPFSEANIYVSYLSYPIAFGLYGNNYLSCIYGRNDMFSLTAHELMHGFATDELTKLYLDYINSNEYLTDNHRRLIDDMHSGNEEEFVMAAEYYLCMKHAGQPKDDLLQDARKRYNGCVPTSVFIFDLLSKEAETPDGYTQWLTNVFNEQKLPQGDIEKALDVVAPRSEADIFWDELFGRFRRIISRIDQIRDSEYTAPLNLSKIEKMTGKKFTEIDENRTLFCQGARNLPHAKTVCELNKDKLWVNVAEYVSHEELLLDNITDGGSNITPPFENGCAVWYVNMASKSESPIAFGVTFIKNTTRFTVTVRCENNICVSSSEYDKWINEILVFSKELFAAQKIVEDIYMAI